MHTDEVVSVVVVTYNSSKYVLETLDSVYRQDYKAIELIISDDCSSDDTFLICKNWLDTHSQRFVRVVLTKTPFNKGISGNYNHALGHVQGKWLKYIAGDDILMDLCVSRFVEETTKNTSKIFFSALIPFSVVDGKVQRSKVRSIGKSCFESKNPDEQMDCIFDVVYWAVEGPTIFLETETFKALGGMDEAYPMLEDLPVALHYLYNRMPIGYIDEALVLYREHPESVSQSNEDFVALIHLILRDYRQRLALRKKRILYAWHLYLVNMAERERIIRKKRGFRYKFYKVMQIVDLYAIKTKALRVIGCA